MLNKLKDKTANLLSSRRSSLSRSHVDASIDNEESPGLHTASRHRLSIEYDRERRPSFSSTPHSISGKLTPSICDEKVREQSVAVVLHIRPLLEPEINDGCRYLLSVEHPFKEVSVAAYLQHNNTFAFDNVYGVAALPSSHLYKTEVQPLVDALFQGYNATVFAYGQTGAGKSYTMGTDLPHATMMSDDAVDLSGKEWSPMVESAIVDICMRVNALRTSGVEVEVTCSFFEIYQDQIRDLLSPHTHMAGASSRMAHTIVVRDPDPRREVILVGLEEVKVKRLEQLQQCLIDGIKARATASTNMNHQSSRSHALFAIRVRQIHKAAGGNTTELSPSQFLSTFDRELRRQASGASSTAFTDMAAGSSDEVLDAKIYLVDLAGSERVSRSHAQGTRLEESCSINQGLLALGNVIEALCDSKRRHVPYRDHVLTRVLRHALGGNSRTLMIACCSPADIDINETLNTLRYAARARFIRNVPTVNRNVTSRLSALKAENELLRGQLAEVQQQLLDLQVISGFGAHHCEGSPAPALPLPASWVPLEDYEAVKVELEQERDRANMAEDQVSLLTIRLRDALAEVTRLASQLVDVRSLAAEQLQVAADTITGGVSTGEDPLDVLLSVECHGQALPQAQVNSPPATAAALQPLSPLGSSSAPHQQRQSYSSPSPAPEVPSGAATGPGQEGAEIADHAGEVHAMASDLPLGPECMDAFNKAVSNPSSPVVSRGASTATAAPVPMHVAEGACAAATAAAAEPKDPAVSCGVTVAARIDTSARISSGTSDHASSAVSKDSLASSAAASSGRVGTATTGSEAPTRSTSSHVGALALLDAAEAGQPLVVVAAPAATRAVGVCTPAPGTPTVSVGMFGTFSAEQAPQLASPAAAAAMSAASVLMHPRSVSGSQGGTISEEPWGQQCTSAAGLPPRAPVSAGGAVAGAGKPRLAGPASDGAQGTVAATGSRPLEGPIGSLAAISADASAGGHAGHVTPGARVAFSRTSLTPTGAQLRTQPVVVGRQLTGGLDMPGAASANSTPRARPPSMFGSASITSGLGPAGTLLGSPGLGLIRSGSTFHRSLSSQITDIAAGRMSLNGLGGVRGLDVAALVHSLQAPEPVQQAASSLRRDHRQKVLIRKRVEADTARGKLLALSGSLMWLRQQQMQHQAAAEGDRGLPGRVAVSSKGGEVDPDPIKQVDHWIRIKTQECELEVIIEAERDQRRELAQQLTDVERQLAEAKAVSQQQQGESPSAAAAPALVKGAADGAPALAQRRLDLQGRLDKHSAKIQDLMALKQQCHEEVDALAQQAQQGLPLLPTAPSAEGLAMGSGPGTAVVNYLLMLALTLRRAQYELQSRLSAASDELEVKSRLLAMFDGEVATCGAQLEDMRGRLEEAEARNMKLEILAAQRSEAVAMMVAAKVAQADAEFRCRQLEDELEVVETTQAAAAAARAAAALGPTAVAGRQPGWLQKVRRMSMPFNS